MFFLKKPLCLKYQYKVEATNIYANLYYPNRSPGWNNAKKVNVLVSSFLNKIFLEFMELTFMMHIEHAFMMDLL